MSDDSNARMEQLIAAMPEQLLVGFRLGRMNAVSRSRDLRLVLVAGMGGSGIGGRLAAGLFYETMAVPLLVSQDYSLPACAGKNTLCVAVSHSGNTEETVTAFRRALELGCKTVVIAGGGELARLGRECGCPLVLVPTGMPPRAALGFLFGTIIGLFDQLRLCPPQEESVAEATALMLARRCSWQRQARAIANSLHDRLPLVYSTTRLLDPVVLRWQSQLNENAKVLCHSHVLPEQNHNEIVGLGGPRFLTDRVVIVALSDVDAHPRNVRRLELLRTLTRQAGCRMVCLETEGQTPLARLLSLVMLGDYVSVELAKLSGVDSMAIPRIDALKKRMALL